EVAHRLHADTADDNVGAVRDVDDQDDPRLKTIGGETEQLIEADNHAIDRLIAKSAQHLARRRIFDELDDRCIEALEFAGEVQRLAAGPNICFHPESPFQFYPH